LEACVQINITYDSSTNAAPSAFFGAITYVVNLFDHLFTNPITLNGQRSPTVRWVIQ
jgi:hypothetical protein